MRKDSANNLVSQKSFRISRSGQTLFLFLLDILRSIFFIPEIRDEFLIEIFLFWITKSLIVAAFVVYQNALGPFLENSMCFGSILLAINRMRHFSFHYDSN